MHSLVSEKEIVPGFFYLYKSIFLKIMRTTDLQKAPKKMVRTIVTLRLLNTYGIAHVLNMIVLNYVLCFVMWMM